MRDTHSPRSQADASPTADVVVIGGGVIGMSTALALVDAGAAVVLVTDERPGTASYAAAGLLAPSIGSLRPEVAAFFQKSRAAYPAFLARLQTVDPELRLLTGLIAISEHPSSASELSSEEIAAIEPSLHAPYGGWLHPDDAALDIARLMRALQRALASETGVQFIDSNPAIRIDARHSSGARVWLRGGDEIATSHVVIAAGAWSNEIGGLPRRIPVFPLKGQMLALDSTELRHPVSGDDVYLVPREAELAIGATAERVGFDLSTDEAAIADLRAAATRLMPSLAHAREVRRWAGFRPATPDLLPCLGPDPDQPRLIYACGHSKNGILLAPGTARAITDLTSGNSTSSELSPFDIARFGLQ